MVTPEQRQEVAALVLSTLRSLGGEDLIPLLTIQWRPFAVRMGDALYDATKGAIVCNIRFSSALWERADDAARLDTVVHEVCHILVMYEAHVAGRKDPPAHGRAWQEMMRRAGATPQRCHHVDPTGLPGRKRRVTVFCACPKNEVSSILANRIARGINYVCVKCNQRLSLSPPK